MSLDLPVWYSQLADTYGCAFLNAAEYACASDADGIHLDAENQRQLGRAIAEKIRHIL